MTRYPDIERVVQRFLDALEAGDTTTMDALLDDEFVYRHRAVELDKRGFLALAKDLHTAFPHLDLHAQLQAIGDRVDGELRPTGTRRRRPGGRRREGEATPALAAGPAGPQEHASWTVHGGKIVRHEVSVRRGGGWESLFAQLGKDLEVGEEEGGKRMESGRGAS